jgi:hypothetical protein
MRMPIQEMLPHGYTNHVDADVLPDGRLAYVIINKNEIMNNKLGRNVHVFEVALPSRIIIRKVKSYVEGVDFPGPAGYCTVLCLPTGQLFVNLSATKTDGSGEVIWKSDVIDNVFQPYTTGIQAGTEALLAAIQYARTNPNQSELRKLIREVIALGS